jgi:hypothetical protein
MPPQTGHARWFSEEMQPHEPALRAYRRRIFKGIDWRVQPNVRNAWGNSQDIPVKSNPDGTIAVIRIPNETRWYPYVTDSNGQQVADLVYPYYSKTGFRGDAFIGYKLNHFLGRKIKWSGLKATPRKSCPKHGFARI